MEIMTLNKETNNNTENQYLGRHILAEFFECDSNVLNNPQLVENMFIEEIQKLKRDGLNSEDFERIKRKIYGEFVTEFNDVASISRMFLADTVKNINSFDYANEYDNVTIEYADYILDEVFIESKIVLSVIKN